MDSPEPPLASPQDKRILIVDDDENVRSFLELAAQMEGFEVATAANGLEAAQKIADRPPDLIITDLMMPGQGGYEFLRQMQGSGQGRIPIIVITGSQINDATAALVRQEANVMEFIRKPVPTSSFVLSLHNILHTAPPNIPRPRGLNEPPQRR